MIFALFESEISRAEPDSTKEDFVKRLMSIVVHLAGAVGLLHIIAGRIPGIVFNIIMGMTMVLILLEGINWNELLEKADPAKNVLLWAGSNFIMWLAVPRMAFDSSVITASIFLVVMVFVAAVVRRDVARKPWQDDSDITRWDRLLQLLDPAVGLAALLFFLWAFTKKAGGGFLSFSQFFSGSNAEIIIHRQLESQLGEAMFISTLVTAFCLVMLAAKSGIYLDEPWAQVRNSTCMWLVAGVLLFTSINVGHGLGWGTAILAILFTLFLSQLDVFRVLWSRLGEFARL